MSDQQPSFEKVLEADLARLATEIRNQRARPELKDANEKELVKEAIRAFPQLEKGSEGVPEAPPTESASRGAAGSTVESTLPAYAQDAPPEVKLEIEYLLDVALRHGLSKALTEARKSPYFVQDTFHDALAGKLYPELQKRGIVK
jgi:hypothetical protein